MSILGDIADVAGDFASGLKKYGVKAVNLAKIPIEKIGEVINDALDQVGDVLNTQLDKLHLSPLGDALNWLLDRTGDKIHEEIGIDLNFTNRFGNFLDTFFDDELWKDPKSWLANNAANALSVPGILERAFSLLSLASRDLTDREVEIGRSVLGISIDYGRVRIEEFGIGSAASFLNEVVFEKGAYTAFNTINWPFRQVNSADVEDSALLVHELVHIWQYQHTGAQYIVGAAQDYGKYGYGRLATLQSRIDASGNVIEGRGLLSFGTEQQGQIVQDYVLNREMEATASDAASLDAAVNLLAKFVKDVSTLSETELAMAPAILVPAVTGTPLDDVLSGDGHRNILRGLEGNDILAGLVRVDQLDGGDGTDTADYSASAAGVGVSLATGVGGGEDAEGDTLLAIENLIGSAFGDVLTGDAGANLLSGLAGDDTLAGLAGADQLDGGDGTDTADYSASAAGVGVSLATGVGGGEDAEGDTLLAIENLIGSAFGDVLTGDAGANLLSGLAGDDTLAGLAGADQLDGGDGTDTADYSASAAGVGVSLATGVGGGEDAEGDTLLAIENLIGSAFGDVLTGDAGANLLSGLAGDDTLAGLAGADQLDGGDGTDTADYSASAAGVGVSLATGVGGGEDAEGDTLLAIENLIGSAFGDVLTGDAGANLLSGLAGDDTLAGLAGADQLDGGDGTDTADYSASAAGVGVSLATGVGGGEDAEGDTLLAIENLIGSAFGDVLTGGAGSDFLAGNADNDILTGSHAIDTLTGGGGRDTLDGGAGSDTLTGGGGGDTFAFGLGADEYPDGSSRMAPNVITDFLNGVDQFMIDRSAVGANDFADDIVVAQIGVNVRITIQNNANVTQAVALLLTEQAQNIDAGDFIFMA